MTFRRAALPVLVLLALGLLAPTTGGANILPNGSFEKGLRSWKPTTAKLSLLRGGVHGSRYVRATRLSGKTFGLYTASGKTMYRGQKVSARVSLRAPSGKRICVRLREKRAGKTIAQGTRCVTATGNWQRPAAVQITTERAVSRVSLTVFGRRSAARNRLDVDRAVVTAPGLAGPAGTVTPGRVITTNRSWQCNGALSAFGKLPIKVVSQIPNPGTADAIRLIGCYGDGNPATVDLILDVRGNGGGLGTGYDAVKIGQSAHDLVVTGRVACGARHGSIHQDVVQAMSGRRIEFRDFVAGNPEQGNWTCWGSGGGWYVAHANGNVPTDVVCVRCRIATYNQNMRIDNAVRSGARNSVFGYSRSYGIFIGPQAVDPINQNNRVIRY